MSDSARASAIYPCGRLARRDFIHQIGGGFLGLALGAVWAEAGEIKETVMGPHHAARAKSVIFLFMCGGVSHIDTFDPKDNKWAGKFIDAIGFGDNLAAMKRPVIPCLRTFTRHGKSGIAVSDWFPQVWTSEFGRTPWSQNTTGRDHNPKGYTSWMAGGGIKGGVVHGGTDEVGYQAVDSPHYYSDLHATILHQLGLNHKQMEVQALGRTMRLVEEGGPIKEIIA